MRKKIAECIDINSKYCPCLLAETNQCIVCSHLQGEETCNCNWTGVCILYEHHWQDKKQLSEYPITTRTEEQVDIIKKVQIGLNTYLLEFQVNLELAEELKRIGSFIFLRCPSDPHFFYFPVNITKVSGNTLQVIVETIGPKSSRIIADNNNSLLVRGPYYNGVLGQPWIDNITNSKIILIAGGIGQAPALPLATKLLNNNNQVIAILAPGKVGEVFIDKELTEMGAMVYTVSSLRQFGMPMLREWLAEKPDLVVSAGPDEQHYGVIAAMQSVAVNLPMVATNNATMCCGEGICGSCLKKTRNDKKIRLCKEQTDFSTIIED
jgi:dihydroorotate dehydrogenase electron transfer subunit